MTGPQRRRRIRSTTAGKHSGPWHGRGRGPNALTGVELVSSGFESPSGYVRLPGGFDPRAAVIYNGIGLAP